MFYFIGTETETLKQRWREPSPSPVSVLEEKLDVPHERNLDAIVDFDALCPQGYVDCVDGYVAGTSESELCSDRCGGLCCTGGNACYGFTGMVCMDGSCSGYSGSCYAANIGHVVKSCGGFKKSCNGANIGYAINSCWQDFSCYGATLGTVLDSCNDGDILECLHAL